MLIERHQMERERKRGRERMKDWKGKFGGEQHRGRRGSEGRRRGRKGRTEAWRGVRGKRLALTNGDDERK